MKAGRPADRKSARILVVGADGEMESLPRTALASLFGRADAVIANDAATLPASLRGVHRRSGEPIEIRLAAWVSVGDPRRFDAIAFGDGDHRTRTEDRVPPPPLRPGDRLALGPLGALVERVLKPPRLIRLRFSAGRSAVLAGLARHGRPVQYSHLAEPLKLGEVWTTIAADPVAFEPPSAGFALDWRTISELRQRGVDFAAITLAAGLSSTGDPALDASLPFDEPFHIPQSAATSIARAKADDGRIVAVGTTVVRALESAAAAGKVRPGAGIARGRIGRDSELAIVDAILTGVHQPVESHFELLRAFASDATLQRMSAALEEGHFRTHEFGDFVLIEGPRRSWRTHRLLSEPPIAPAQARLT